jgi:leucine dehydrogenase
MLEDLIREWDGEEIVTGFDRPSGTWMFVCVHSTRRGPAGGGTRMKVYADPAEALTDAMRLSSAMTLKMAAFDVPFGGGKAVISVPEIPDGDERRRMLLRYGDLAASLGATFQTGPDVNTSSSDMDVIAERHTHVYCRSEENGGSGDPGPFTAQGVYHGIRSSLRRVFGTDELEGRTVLVQGVGDVGGPLAEQLAADGARVLISDVADQRVRELVDRISAEAVAPESALETTCDVYAPCALGATVNAESIPGMRCRIVAGSANNQLAEPKDAERLRDAGILYAPDYVINAGGVIYAWGTESLGWERAAVESRLEAIGDTLADIYERADTEGISTEQAAEAIARGRLG